MPLRFPHPLNNRIFPNFVTRRRPKGRQRKSTPPAGKYIFNEAVYFSDDRKVSLEFLEFNLHTFGWLITSYSSDSELFKLAILLSSISRTTYHFYWHWMLLNFFFFLFHGIDICGIDCANCSNALKL